MIVSNNNLNYLDNILKDKQKNLKTLILTNNTTRIIGTPFNLSGIHKYTNLMKLDVSYNWEHSIFPYHWLLHN